MTRSEYYFDRMGALKRISEKRGISIPHLILRYALDRCFYNASFEDFCTFQLYERSSFWKSNYLTWWRVLKLSAKFNTKATKADYVSIGEKARFNALFHNYIHRDWLYIPDSTPEEIRCFIERNSKFLLKENVSTQGRGILLFDHADINLEDFLRKYQGKPLLMESFIQQHSIIAAPNPSSVNTVRIVTARKGDNVLYVGAGLRCGGSNSFVDNLHNGGAAYPINLETGIVSGPGIDYRAENTYLRHPSTGYIMPGLQIPHWEELLAAVREAAMLTSIGYIGWDIAIAEDNVEFVEANVACPGVTVIQLDRPDAYKRLKIFYKENK